MTVKAVGRRGRTFELPADLRARPVYGAVVMSEEYETERELSRDEIADIFENFAAELRGDDELTLTVGGEHVHINPPETCEFEVEVEEESRRLRSPERSVEFEIEWTRQQDERDLVDPE